MSTGRHARKRAAKAQERLINEQESLLKKEEKKKTLMENDVETQRIATMRARFGGQTPSTSASPTSSQNLTAMPEQNKFKTPAKLTGGTNPMKQTLMGMMLDNDQQQAG